MSSSWSDFVEQNPDRVSGRGASRAGASSEGGPDPDADGEDLGHDLTERAHKYGASPKHRDGFRFDSQLEARYYDHLKFLRDEAGEILMFLRQVPFHLDGGTILRIDFVVFWQDGSVTFEDTKGHVTNTFKVKRREVEAKYPVTLKIVKKSDF